jgi:3-oxoacyl-[acyl-carrier protein] reductase
MTERLSTLSRSIAQRTAVITGAASGMGRATAHLFADEGANVVVADRSADRVATVVSEISAVHGAEGVLGVVGDVGDPDDLRDLVAQTDARFGALDIVVNNAGIALRTPLDQANEDFEEQWAQTLAVNLSAHVRLVRAALSLLKRSDAGRVVNIASTEAIVTTAGASAYAATKAGVVGLTRSLATELGPHAITVNCVCPGPIETAMTESIPDESKAVYAKRRVPLRRYGIAEEVAQMTLNLCLPASSFVTGATIVVDGGMSIRHT